MSCGHQTNQSQHVFVILYCMVSDGFLLQSLMAVP